MALELVKDLSPKSWVSQRLWRTVEALKDYAPKLGLHQDEDPRKRDSAALTMAGMAGSGHNQHGSHRSSVSSGGHQPTPSPGLTPGYGGHQRHPSSRMGSLTPHGGRHSPRSAVGQHSQRQQTSHSDDPSNGLRLQTEMSRIFEEIANGGHREHSQGGADDLFAGQMGEYSAGGSADYGPLGEAGQLYPRFRELF